MTRYEHELLRRLLFRDFVPAETHSTSSAWRDGLTRKSDHCPHCRREATNGSALFGLNSRWVVMTIVFHSWLFWDIFVSQLLRLH